MFVIVATNRCVSKGFYVILPPFQIIVHDVRYAPKYKLYLDSYKGNITYLDKLK